MGWWTYGFIAMITVGVSIIAMVLIGTRITVRYKVAEAGSMADPGFVVTLEALTNSSSATATAIRFYGDVESIYEAMLEAIASAERSVTFETYLFWPGKIGDRFGEVLMARARAGVHVKVLLDADGCRKLPRRFMHALREAGCEVKLFRPLVWYQPIQYNHRTHRKILVIDGKVGFTGGIGVADMWYGPPAWLETMVRLEGDVVGLLQGAFFQNWVIAGGALSLGENYFPRRPAPGELAKSESAIAHAMVTTSSPIWGDSSMRLLYYTAIGSAEKRILLASPYFLPNWDTAALFAAAAARGVDVRLLLVGPENDKKLPWYASRRLYGHLIAAGVRIYEYQPAMMHAKFMVIDDRWTTIGSTNFDPRSFFLNSEVNASVDDPAFASEVTDFFEASLKDAKEITYDMWRRRGLWEHFAGWLGLIFKDQL